MHSVLRNRSALGQKCNVQFKHKFEYTTDITLGRIVRLKLSSAFSLVIYRDIFLTLNIAHTYSLCLVLKNTGQCMYVIT
jgi:hypothetical protein